jgi:hypothetical protein
MTHPVGHFDSTVFNSNPFNPALPFQRDVVGTLIKPRSCPGKLARNHRYFTGRELRLISAPTYPRHHRGSSRYDSAATVLLQYRPLVLHPFELHPIVTESLALIGFAPNRRIDRRRVIYYWSLNSPRALPIRERHGEDVVYLWEME